MSIEEGSRTESVAMLKGHQPGSLAGAGECGLGGRCTHPREDGEEGEGDGSPGRVCPFVQRVVLGDLPLVGQVAEAHEPQEGPEGWGMRGARRTPAWGERAKREAIGNRGMGDVQEHVSHAPPPPKGEEVGVRVGRAQARCRRKQRGRSDAERERDHRKNQPGREQIQGGPGSERGGETQRGGETEKSQSASAGVSLTSANTRFLAESLTDPWSTLRPAALWEERPPKPAASQRTGQGRMRGFRNQQV